MKGNVADKFRAQLKLTEAELRQALAGAIGALRKSGDNSSERVAALVLCEKNAVVAYGFYPGSYQDLFHSVLAMKQLF